MCANSIAAQIAGVPPAPHHSVLPPLGNKAVVAHLGELVEAIASLPPLTPRGGWDGVCWVRLRRRYVHLVDADGKARFVASGEPTPKELKAMVECAQKLLRDSPAPATQLE